jgi:hypothetical protein
LIEKFIWFFANLGAYRLLGLTLLPILAAWCIYQSQYPYVLLRSLWDRAFGDGFRPFAPGAAPSLGMTIPTLLRNRDDLAGLEVGIASAITARYPGRLTVIAVIDGVDAAPELVSELGRWVDAQSIPENVVVEVVGTSTRVGKAHAADVGVRHIVALAARGEIPEKPPIYFNMDADCEMGPHALERMVRALERPSRIHGQPGMIVTSHVAIRERDYWGPDLWRGFWRLFTLRGQIAINVAREYAVAIGVGRQNVLRLLPQNGASGALFCTWFDVVEAAPHWAKFLGELRVVDWMKWWLGAPPPRFDTTRVEALPEAMTGMGEDTWMSWLALAGRMENGRVSLALPRTPAHALWYAFVGFFARPFRYDPHAKIYTTTPTTIRALFVQRVRWNVSRIWTVQVWGVALLYHFVVGLPAIFDVVVSTAFQATIVAGFLLAPFSGHVAAMAPALLVLVELVYFVERTLGTLLALLQDRGEKGRWKKLLALPFSGTFHLLFNVATTISGFVRQVFGNGYNDRFAPETALVTGGTSRIALGYRFRRFFALAWRSVIHGDVPLGWFWLGWHATKWTPNGYEGWTTGNVPPIIKPLEPVITTIAAPARAEVASGGVVLALVDAAHPSYAENEELPDSGIRRRVQLESAGERKPPVSVAS